MEIESRIGSQRDSDDLVQPTSSFWNQSINFKLILYLSTSVCVRYSKYKNLAATVDTQLEIKLKRGTQMNSNSIELDDREMWKHCFTSTIFIVEANSGLTVQLGHAKSFPCIIMVKIVVHYK